MKIYKKISIILALVLISFTNLSALSQQERDALMALYNSTNGDNWTNSSNWGIEDPCDNNWYGVYCEYGTLRFIDLPENQLTGSIPIEITNLTSLRALDLRSNQIMGTIPEEIGNLDFLVFLSLNENQLTGSIPTEIGNLTNLATLALNDNYLSGEIPSSIIDVMLSDSGGLSLDFNCNLYSDIVEVREFIVLKSYFDTYEEFLATQGNCQPSLERTALVALYNSTDGANWINSSNWNTGDPCDDSWYGVTCNTDGNVTKIILDNNQLTGSIPAEIGNLTNLESIFLDNNQLTGSIPTEITNLVNLSLIHLRNNQLTGNIPTEITNLTNLTYLYLDGNQLTGSIPADIGNITYLNSLCLSTNHLSGEIPSSITQLVYLDACGGFSSGITLDTNCNLYSNDIDVQNFITQKAGMSYEAVLASQGNCQPETPTLAPVIMYLLN